MPGLQERFDAKVDRSRDHHLWTGAKQASGVGLIRVDGKLTTARRVAWELAHGPVPSGARVLGCGAEPACVRIDHLALERTSTGKPIRSRAARGAGTKVKVRDGVYKLTVSAGRYEDGKRRRIHQTVLVDNEDEAERVKAGFVTEVHEAPLPALKAELDIVVDEGIERYLTEYLIGEKGREASTIQHYRTVHRKWFSPFIGRSRVRDVDEATMDRLFGNMRRAGLSASRMNDARSLYAPFFRWAKRRRIIRRSPMADFELPTSTHVPQERTPPEVEQLVLYLETAVVVVPDVAPALTLDAVTGIRRGELVTLRRSRLFPAKRKIKVDASFANDGKRVKSTKTRTERELAIAEASMAMLLRHCERMDERAAALGVTIAPDGFVFSLEPDCSVPMPADYLTKQVAKLKEHLGISDKRPETIEMENAALRLYRQARGRRAKGKPGPRSKGAMSYKEIGRRLGRSERWAWQAVASAKRREAAANRGLDGEVFDGSILALRKFTSSELLDAGFNISMVAQRQGQGPQVLAKHYSKRRQSADRKAADHLGKVVHGT